MRKILSFILILIITTIPVYAEKDTTYSLGIYHQGEWIYEFNNSDVNTRYNFGSIAKVFAASMVGSMIDDGQVTLDQDIGELLEEEDYEGITLFNLLTHTSGIEQRGMNTANTKKESRGSVNQVLKPGEAVLYSSIGMSLIEDVVAKVSGKPYKEALSDRVIEPLKMSSTNFTIDKMPFNYEAYETNIPSTGNIVSNLKDMEKIVTFYMTNDETLFGNPLKESMMDLQFSNGSVDHGRGLGFSITSYKGYKVVYHDGGAPGTNSRLYMIPELELAFILAYNSNSFDFKHDKTEVILSKYVLQDISQEKSEIQDIPKFSGAYIPLENSLSTIEKLNILFEQITVTGGEKLKIGSREYLYQEDGVYYRQGSPAGVTFKTIDNADYMLIGNSPYRKASIFENLYFWLGVLLFGLLGTLVIFTVRNIEKSRMVSLSKLSALMALLAFLGLAYYLANLDYWLIAYGMPLIVTLLSTLVVLAALLSSLFIYKKRNLLKRDIVSLIGQFTLVVFILNFNLLI